MMILSLPARTLHSLAGQTRKLWVRVVLIGLLAVAGLGLARLAGVFVPDRLAQSVDITSVDRLLNIMSNSMLAVTTFSLTVMVSVYRSTASQWTPRLHRLIVEDKTTQNTLAAFIGAYVYALTGIVLRETGLFTQDQAFLIFYLTVAVMAMIIVYMIRWTLHLQGFGSLISSTRQIEDIALCELSARMDRPCLDCHPLSDTAMIPKTATPIHAPIAGYVQVIYTAKLQDCVQGRLFVTAEVGSYVQAGAVLAWLDGKGVPDAICDAFVLDEVRNFDSDPRFGLMVMAEIASKALSPGINDPGTAIDVITRQGRILAGFTHETLRAAAVHDRVWYPPLCADDLVEDAFAAIGRDGAAVIEVQQRLQRTLSGLAAGADQAMQQAARDAAVLAYQRAAKALTFHGDLARLRNSTPTRVKELAEAG